MKKFYDAVIVGAGFAGSVCARVLAEGGRRVLLLDRRDHIGGNAYDEKDESGVLIHKYGPHIFCSSQEGTGKSGSYGMWNHPRGHVWNVFVRPASS